MGSEASEVDHAADHEDHDHVHPLEALPYLWDFGEEVGVVLFLGCGSPAHIDGEHMRADGKQDVERDSAEEDTEEWHPLEVLEEGTQQTGFADAEAHDREADIGHSVEDDDQDDEDVPGLDVVLVELTVEPADQEVVQGTERNS